MALGDFIYKRLKNIAEVGGYNLVISKKGKRNSYETVIPNASYAPWLADTAFKKIYKVVENYSLVDKYRCYELWQLVAEAKKLDGALIEVGVWRGGSASLIAKKAELLGIKDSVYFCDTFEGVVKADKQDSTYRGGEHADASRKKVEELINKLKLRNTKILVGIFPDESGSMINEKRFRFCHIDVDVYKSAKDTLKWIWPKLVVGGIIVFDDYGFVKCEGITKFVNEERNKKDRVVIHNLNGHAVMVKLSDQVG